MQKSGLKNEEKENNTVTRGVFGLSVMYKFHRTRSPSNYVGVCAINLKNKCEKFGLLRAANFKTLWFKKKINWKIRKRNIRV